MKPIHKQSVALWKSATSMSASIFLMAAIGTAADAQSCPTDLSAAASQLQTSRLQPLTTRTVDDVVAAAGGLEQAIAEANDLLSSLNSQLSRLPADAPPDQSVVLGDAILLIQTSLSALECRKLNPQ